MRSVMRIIDVNINRAQEGLRVCEDITRFAINDRKTCEAFKSLRHRVAGLAKRLRKQNATLLQSRNIRGDVGRKTTYRESRRRNIEDVLSANIQRVKESLRVLEEVGKLLDRRISQGFKKIRFRVYELEKKSGFKLEAIRHSG